MTVDWTDYKALCDGPSVMSRWALETTRDLVRNTGAEASIGRALREPPIDKPEGHKGGLDTDCFHVAVPVSDVDVILRHIEAAAGAADDARARRLRHLGVVWREYLTCVGGAKHDA